MNEETNFVVDEVKCKECKLWETSSVGHIRRSGVYGRGSGRLGLWLYGEDLGSTDVKTGLPLSGDSGIILSKILREIQLPEEELYITSTLRCRPPSDRNPKAAEIKSCMSKHAALDIPATLPKLIVTLGTVPLRAVLGKQKIKENRGVLFDCEMFNCKAIATYNPAAIMYNKKTNIYDTLKADLIKAKEFVLGAQEKALVRHSILINSRESLLSWTDLMSSPEIKIRTCDIETTGLSHTDDKIISISFTFEYNNEIYSVAFLCVDRPEWWYADLDDPEIRAALQKVLSLPTCFHNGLFDVKFFWKLKYAVYFIVDTMDQHLMIDENSPHNLQYCVSVYNKEDEGYKQNITNLLGEDGIHAELSPQTLLVYNNEDTYNTFLLNKKFTPLIEAEHLDEFFNRLVMPLKRSLTRMSYRGIMMDRQGLIDLSNSYRDKLKLKRQELYDKVGKEFNYSKADELKTVLFKELDLPIVKRTPTGQPSSDKYALEELARISEVPKMIMDLRKWEYSLRMYLDGNDLPLSGELKPENGFLNYLDENDRIHGPFLSGGTISGRPSCPKPNLLNIPKNPEIRQLFIAPEGWKLIDIDYSQAELALLAHLSGDEQFIKDVSSQDFHLATAKSLMKLEEVSKDARSSCKSVNFLKSYGGGAVKLGNALRLNEEKKFFDDFKKSDKIEQTCSNTEGWYHNNQFKRLPLKYHTVNPERKVCYVCEAKNWLSKWDDTYKKVPVYKQEQMNLWKSQGFIMGLYGRKKHFPPIFNRDQEAYCDRISVNYMCQNGVSETVNRSLVDIDNVLDLLFGWTPSKIYQIPGIVLGVYDSIIGEAPDHLVPEIKELMTEIMSLPIPKLNIPLKCDVNITQRWGEKLDEVEIDPVFDELEELDELG